MVTLEDIETEIDSSKQVGARAKIAARLKASAMNQMIRQLKKQKGLLEDLADEERRLGMHSITDGKKIIKALINGNRPLSAEEMLAVKKKFGTSGIGLIEGLACLNVAQKQWIFKQMGWDIKEVE